MHDHNPKAISQKVIDRCEAVGNERLMEFIGNSIQQTQKSAPDNQPVQSFILYRSVMYESASG